MSPLAFTACEYGPIACGAWSVWMISFTVATASFLVMQTKAGLYQKRSAEGKAAKIE